MSLERLIEGPAWTGVGIQESAGRYPLRVETAVSNIVGRLLPGVITTTRHARMYSLHTLAWAVAHERGLDHDDAADFVRRCEVVIAGIHHFHAQHRIKLSSAHGEGALDRFLTDDRLDVTAAAELNVGLSAEGFADVYQGPCVAIGALTAEQYPRPGVRADLPVIRAGLGDLLDLAGEPSLTAAQLARCRTPLPMRGGGGAGRQLAAPGAGRGRRRPSRRPASPAHLPAPPRRAA